MKQKALSFILVLICLLTYSPKVHALNQWETPSGIPLLEIEDFIDTYMEQYIGKTSPGAAVVLVKDGEILFSKGYGYANLEQRIPVDAKETIFEYGSISKLFVYTTLMRLVEENRIVLDADIRQHLPPNFLKKLQFDNPITFLDIMNHTTGFEDYLFDLILTTTEKEFTMEQSLMEAQPRQVYKPGTISAYSNYSVALGAYIAEQILGQEYHEYLMDTVFLSLGMTSTSTHPLLADHPELLERRAITYARVASDRFEPGAWSYIPLYPVGAANGTAEDLARFAMALMPEDGKESPLFNKRETLEEMLSQSRAMGPGLTGFAHGFIEWDGEYRTLGHGGNTAYSSSQVNVVPKERFGVIILTNAANEMDITLGLTEALLGQRNQDVPEGALDLPNPKEIEGAYIGARKMYSGFLDLYGYLSMLHVKALDDRTIEMRMAGQSSILVQTAPYVYQRTEAKGSIFEYHFSSVYFEVSEGNVLRLSGDFIPLPPGRTMPWLLASLLIAAFSAAYFLLTPIALGIAYLRRKRKGSFPVSPTPRVRKLHTLLVLTGTATVVNAAVLVLRMLSNNFRSFSEMRIHILLNYPLLAVAAILSVLLAVHWRGAALSHRQKFFYAGTVFVMIALLSLLLNWQFFSVIA